MAQHANRPNAGPGARVSALQLASLSHEFRTPLNGVIGMARLLESTRLTAEQRAYLSALKDSGEHLLSLVNELLDFAKLDAGRIELHPQRMDPAELLRGVSELISPRAQEKGLEIAWAVPADLPLIQADEGRLRQILLNFVGNAVKFTAAGGALISAEARDGTLRFVVADSGPGIPEAERDRIFEAFAQIEPAHAALSGGAGLGLAIVRRLAEAMGGEAGIEESQFGGAAFWLEAPFAEANRRPAEPQLAGLRVGLASGNAIVREAALRQLSSLGAEVSAQMSLAAAVEATHPGDAILLDYGLLRGKALRPPARRKTLVMLTPAERGELDRLRGAGFAGYLIKPLRPSSVAERIRAVLDRTAVLIAREDERAAPAAAPGARVLLAEDDPVSAMLARALLKREGCDVQHVGDGPQLIEALRTGSFDLILMDVRMPGMTGLEATRSLRSQGDSTPIVALTANAFDDDRRACLEAGMNDFLVKPLAPDALRATLARWARGEWSGRSQADDLGDAQLAPQAIGGAPVILGRDRL